MTRWYRREGEKHDAFAERVKRWDIIAAAIEEIGAGGKPFRSIEVLQAVPHMGPIGGTLHAMADVGFLEIDRSPSSYRRPCGRVSRNRLYRVARKSPPTPSEAPPAPEPVYEGIEAQARRWAVYGRSAAVTRICREYGIPYRKAVAIVEAAQ